MLFSGYQLGIHLLNSTFEPVSIEREEAIKDCEPIRVVEHQLQQEARTRNSTFTVEGPFKGRQKKFFVKQPRFVDPNLISSILNESYVLQLFQAAGFTQLNTFIGYDRFQHLLFQRFVEGTPFSTRVQPSATALAKLAQQLGTLFSNVHGITESVIDKASSAWFLNKFGYRKPLFFVYSIRDFEEIKLGTPSPEQLEVIQLLANDQYALFRAIKLTDWQPRVLIHNDIKLDHLLFDTTGQITTLFDWEMADIGDPHWDVAHIWLELMRPYMSDRVPVSTIVANSIPALNAFFSTYTSEEAISARKLKQFLGILILQKHFYRLFNMGIEKVYIQQWLELAARLIATPDVLPYAIDSHKTARSTVILRVNNVPDRVLETNPKSRLGTMRQLNELVHLIATDYLPSTTPQLSLTEYIYRWFNGNRDRVVNTSTQTDARLLPKAQVARPPKLGSETLLEDYWWRVEGYSKNNSVNIRRGSVRRVAELGTFIYLRHDARNFLQSGVWSYVKCLFPNFIVRPNDAQAERDDFWVYSQIRLPQDYTNWVRFYFNLKGNIAGINLFVDTLSSKLNERQIPFEIKLRNALSSYTRTDSAILFIHRQHTTAALDAITYTYHLLVQADGGDRSTDGFIDITASPKLTKSIRGFGGLSYGENPTEPKVSFGTWRAQLMAGFIGELVQQQAFRVQPVQQQTDTLKARILEGFERLGFNNYELYRNPYPKDHEYKYRIDLLAQKLRHPALLNAGLQGSATYLPQQRFLQAARQIGFILCREAVWYGKYCTWFCFKQEIADRGFFETATLPDKLGIALFLCQLALLCPQEHIFSECVWGVTGDRDKSMSDCLQLIEAQLRKTMLPVVTLNETVDYRILHFVLYTERTADSAWKVIPLAEKMVEKFIDKKIPFPNAYVATNLDPVSTEFNPTLTHGLAALGYFFLLVVDNPDVNIESLSTYYTYPKEIPGFRDQYSFFV